MLRFWMLISCCVLSLMSLANPDSLRMESLLRLTDCYYTDFENQKSLDTVKQTTEYFKQKEMWVAYGLARRFEGLNYHHLGDFKKAYSLFEKEAVFLKSKLADRPLEYARFLQEWANVCAWSYKRLDRRKLNYQEILLIYEELLPQDHFLIEQSYYQLTLAEIDLHNPKEFEKAVNRLIEHQKKKYPNGSDGLAVSYLMYGNQLMLEGEIGRALTYLDSALWVTQGCPTCSPYGNAIAYLRKAEIYQFLNNNYRSKYFIEKARKVVSENPQILRKIKRHLFVSISEDAKHSMDFQKCIEFSRKTGKAISEQYGKSHGLHTTVYEKMSFCFNHLNEHDSALVYAHKYLNLSKSGLSKNHVNVGKAYLNIARLLPDESDSILYYIDHAIQLHKKRKLRRNLFLADAYREKALY